MIGEQTLHYEITDKLGEGGMGVVYKAWDTKLNRNVSIKMLPDQSVRQPESHDRFLQEARSIAKINHPNICQIYGIEEHSQGRQFIVMEFIDGLNLKETLAEGGIDSDEGPISTSSHFSNGKREHRILDFALQIARGLDAAHSMGVIHRDIKPENILVTPAGVVKILDFGLAKIAGTDDLTRDGSTLGTISYMSPEQIRGDELDPRSDIWSFGVVLYQMVTGKLPFAGDYEHSIMYSILNTDLPQPGHSDASLPEGLDRIIETCLSKDPAGRYQSSAELLKDLALISGSSTSELNGLTPTAKLTASSAPKEKNRSLLFASGGLAGLIFLGLIFYMMSETETNRVSTPQSEFIHLAVLPFSNIGADPGRQVFTDGLVETITSQLSQLERFKTDLWVVPSGDLRNNNVLSAGEAYRMFGVNYAIAGSLQPIADRLRLTITLIDSKNLRQLNSKVIDVDATEVLELHNKSVENLLAMLNLELNTETLSAIDEGNTTNTGAFELYLQGLGYLQQYQQQTEKINSAILAFESAIEKDPQFALAMAGLGQAYWRQYQNTRDRNWIDRAKRQTESALKLNQNLLQANITRGLISNGTGEYQEAVNYYQKALLTDPTNADAYRGLAQAYELRGDLPKAEETFKRSIQMKPNHWAGYNSLGAFYFQNNRYEEAKAQFRRVIDITPDNYRGYMNLGSMYYFTGQTEQARLMYERSIELEKTYSVASNLGTLYYTQGLFEKSAEMYETALEINDGDYLIWGNLAVATYYTPGMKQKAQPIYERAIELALDQYEVNPNNPDILISLAGYQARIGNERESRLNIRKALELAPESATIMYLAGSAYEYLGDRENARHWIQKSILSGYPLTEIKNHPEMKDLLKDREFSNFLSFSGIELNQN